jgi:hypothetical protein
MVRTVATCDRADCGKEHVDEHGLDLLPLPNSTPLHVMPVKPPRWHSIDGRWYCSLACMSIVIDEAVRRSEERL